MRVLSYGLSPWIAGAIALYWVFVIIIIIAEDREPTTTLAWILMLILFPIIGLVLYFFAGRDWTADGLLFTRPGLTLIPYVWQDVPEAEMPALLRDIRRVLSPVARSVAVEGDLEVLPVHTRHDDHDAIMLVNLTHEPRRVSLRLGEERTRLTELDGAGVPGEIRLQPDEVRVLLARS